MSAGGLRYDFQELPAEAAPLILNVSRALFLTSNATGDRELDRNFPVGVRLGDPEPPLLLVVLLLHPVESEDTGEVGQKLRPAQECRER